MEPLVGIDLEDLRLPIKEGLKTAQRLKFPAIEVPAASGEASPEQLDASGRRHLARLTSTLGLKLSSLSADMPGLHLGDPKTVQERVERTIKIIELAYDLRVPVVTSAVGRMIHSESGEASLLAVQALARIGEFADSRGVFYAIRPSHETGAPLAKILDSLRCPSIQVGLDPAAMVMSGTNPLSEVEKYAQQIAHFHARDATAGLGDRPGHETRLGEGDVDLVGCVMVLQAAEYRGAHILRRTESQCPLEDIIAGKNFLNELYRSI